MVYITEMESVYCAVRAEFLKQFRFIFVLRVNSDKINPTPIMICKMKDTLNC